MPTVSTLAAAGVMVKGAVFVTPASDALIETPVLVVTEEVAMEKDALRVPAGTSTLAGVLARVLLLDRVTVVPPAGALPLSVTVPCDEAPPTTLDGLRVRAERITDDGGGVLLMVETALVVLSALFGSKAVLETKASLRNAPDDIGVRTVIVTLAVALLETVPRLQVNVLMLSGTEQVPWAGVAERKAKLGLSLTVSAVEAAASGPALRTLMV